MFRNLSIFFSLPLCRNPNSDSDISGFTAFTLILLDQGHSAKGNAIGTCLEHRLSFLGGEIDKKGHLLEDGLEGGLDGLHVGGRERCVDVLVRHVGAPWG